MDFVHDVTGIIALNCGNIEFKKINCGSSSDISPLIADCIYAYSTEIQY